MIGKYKIHAGQSPVRTQMDKFTTQMDRHVVRRIQQHNQNTFANQMKRRKTEEINARDKEIS